MCGFILALVHAVLLRLPFCGPQEVDHVFWEILSVLILACADTWINEAVIFVACVFIFFGPVCLVLVSYTSILQTILKIQSREGQRKAFSTYSFQLCVVGLFFVTAMVIYMIPDFTQRKEQEKKLSLFHSLFNPTLIPSSTASGMLRRRMPCIEHCRQGLCEGRIELLARTSLFPLRCCLRMT